MPNHVTKRTDLRNAPSTLHLERQEALLAGTAPNTAADIRTLHTELMANLALPAALDAAPKSALLPLGVFGRGDLASPGALERES
jgi:hypothetical protein